MEYWIIYILFSVFAISLTFLLVFLIGRDYLYSLYREIEAATIAAESMSAELIRSNERNNQLSDYISSIRSMISNSNLNPTQSLELRELLNSCEYRINMLRDSLETVMEEKKEILQIIEDYSSIIRKYEMDSRLTANSINELNNVVETLMTKNSHLETMIERSQHSYELLQASADSVSEFVLTCPNFELSEFALRVAKALHNEVISKHIANHYDGPDRWQEVFINSNVRSLIDESLSILSRYNPEGIDRIGWLDLPNPFN